MYMVDFYTTKNGKKPVMEFIKEVKDKNVIKIIDRHIALLEEFGPLLTEPHSKPIMKNIRELRPDNIRILYTMLSDKSYLLLHAFYKKEDKIKPREIIKARNNLKDHLKGVI